MHISFKGSSSYLPSEILTNTQLEQKVNTSHDWIVKRTGISERRIANEETTSDLAFNCSKSLLTSLNKTHIDGIIVATTTPDYTFPSVATVLQGKLSNIGITSNFAFDTQAVCAGFAYAVTIANSMMLTGSAKSILVIGADTLSKIVDWTDRKTCILFGDGAGAILLESETSTTNQNSTSGILATHIASNGSLAHILKTNGGPSTTQKSGFIEMDGAEVFKHAVKEMSNTIEILLKSAKLTLNDIDWVIPHQANERIFNKIAEILNISNEKIINTISHHGNTSAASIPLALDSAIKNNKIKKGDTIAITALGAGLTWGGFIIKI